MPHAKKIRLLSSLCVVPFMMGTLSLAAEAKNIAQQMKLNDVTVFLRGAELFSSSTINLPAGESEIVFSNVAGRLNQQSLSLSATNGALVLSSTVSNDYLVDNDAALSPEALALKKQIEAGEIKQERLNIRLGVIAEQMDVLKSNKQLITKEGSVNAAEVGKMVELIAKHMTAALIEEADVKREGKKLGEELNQLRLQFQQVSNKGFQPGGQVVVKFYSPKATASQVRMSYVVNEAGWVPNYDLNIAKQGGPVDLTYKASIHQNTGISWDKVNLTLSTGNPSSGVQAPVLNPWGLSIYIPQRGADQAMNQAMSEAAVVSGAVMSPAPQVMKANEYSRVKNQPLDDYITTNAGGINTSYAIGIPYTVPSDGKGHMVMVKSAKLDATYQYVVTPKLDRDAFLQARLSKWEDLNLLPGRSSVYFENSFVGQGNVSLLNVKEGLDLSLGREKRILVERIEDANNRGSAGIFGSNLQRSYAYTIKVHNTRPDAITLEVKDQLPVSRDASITLQDIKLAGGKYDDKTGEVIWTLKLKAGEKQSISYSYSVRYPKDAQIQGL